MGAMKKKTALAASGKPAPKGPDRARNVLEGLERDENGNYIFDDTWKVIRIPEGALSMEDVDKNGNLIKRPEPTVKRPAPKKAARKARGNGAAVTMSDVEAALGRGYSMEPDRSYKCRRWIVTKGQKEWRIRFNGRLADAIKEIKKSGAAAWLKKHTMEGR